MAWLKDWQWLIGLIFGVLATLAGTTLNHVLTTRRERRNESRALLSDRLNRQRDGLAAFTKAARTRDFVALGHELEVFGDPIQSNALNVLRVRGDVEERLDEGGLRPEVHAKLTFAEQEMYDNLIALLRAMRGAIQDTERKLGFEPAPNAAELLEQAIAETKAARQAKAKGRETPETDS
jgi:hypothetical protein